MTADYISQEFYKIPFLPLPTRLIMGVQSRVFFVGIGLGSRVTLGGASSQGDVVMIPLVCGASSNVGLGGSNKALGIGLGTAGVWSFLRNRQFCNVILPDLSILIQYGGGNNSACYVPLIVVRILYGNCITLLERIQFMCCVIVSLY